MLQINKKLISKNAIFTMLIIFLIIISSSYPQLRKLGYRTFVLASNKYLNYKTSEMHIHEGDYFKLKYAEGDADIALFVLELAEKLYPQVLLELESSAEKKKGLIVLYPDNTSLNKSFGWGNDRNAVGVYWAGTIRLLSPHAYLKDGSIAEKQVLFNDTGPLAHELTHLVVDNITNGNYTRWFTEGLAQYIEKKLTGYALPQPNNIKESDLYPFSKLDRSFDCQTDQVLAYWQSLRAVEYLIETYGMQKINEFLYTLSLGESFDPAFEKCFKISPLELEKRI